MQEPSSNKDRPHWTRSTIAPLRNVAEFCELIELCGGRAANLPGMALFYGPSGFGKSSAAAYATGKYNALHIQLQSLWTAKKFARAMAIEAGLSPRGSAADMVEQVSEYLATTQRPLVIDEADYLLEKANMINIPRDIFEASQAPVILIGEENMPGKLKRWERLDGRLLARVPAQPGTRTDVDHLAKIYAPGVEIPGDLKDRIHRESTHSIRRMATNLHRVWDYANSRSLAVVTSEDFGPDAFPSGAAPAPRRVLVSETNRAARRAS
ncbi:MAG: ATP-binding protein [Pseudomonadota bacterium]